MQIKRRGFMVVLSSPSGAGKTTLAKHIIEHDPSCFASVSVTTRPPRPREKEGIDYYFVSQEEFQKLKIENAFFETAHVFGNNYGTLRKPVMEHLDNGHDVVFDIDWQGTQQIAQEVPQDIVTIFILPPSYSSLNTRLRSRAEDSQEVITKRMDQAKAETSHWPEYKYIIINDDLQSSIEKLQSIITAERQVRRRLVGLPDFIKTLG